MTCTKTGPKNDPFFNCRRKTKELSKKELSNVAPASDQYRERDISDSSQLSKIIEENINLVIILAKIKLFQKIGIGELIIGE